MNISSERRN